MIYFALAFAVVPTGSVNDRCLTEEQQEDDEDDNDRGNGVLLAVSTCHCNGIFINFSVLLGSEPCWVVSITVAFELHMYELLYVSKVNGLVGSTM